jgi:hypothetical protein
MFEKGERNDLGDYRAIMICLVFSKLFGALVENKISNWIEEVGKRAKVQVSF